MAQRLGSKQTERGASLVEFALVFPVMVMMVFGMISAGVAYNRNLTLSHAAQQGTRFAATLPLSSYTDTDASGSNVDEWLDAVFSRVTGVASGELTSTAPGREICIAFVDEDSGKTASSTWTTSDTAPTETTDPCFADSLPTSEIRTQISVERKDAIDLVVFGTVDITLAREAVSLYMVEEP